MGLIAGAAGRAMSVLFGNGGNVVARTAEVFRENAEAAGVRQGDLSAATLAQFAAEFAQPRRSVFDAVMDGVNRLPRPALALGTLGLFAAAMTDPVWFAARMQGLALVPEPLWWLMGAVVTFYFGARHQAKGQIFQRSIAETVAMTPAVIANVERLERLQLPPVASPPATPSVAAPTGSAAAPGARDPRANWALADWRAGGGG